MTDANHLPFMTLQREYEALASLLVRRGWRRERHYFYPPAGDVGTARPLREAVEAELTAAYCRVRTRRARARFLSLEPDRRFETRDK